MNSPIEIASTRPVSIFHHILGYSYLIHKLMIRLEIQVGGYRGTKSNENRTGASPEGIACLIFQELKAIPQQTKIKNVYVLIQYPADLSPDLQSRVDHAKNCIDTAVITIIDLKSPLLEVKNLSPERYDAFFRGHMTSEGNYFVAQNIVNRMRQKP